MLHKPAGQSIIKAANRRESEWTRSSPAIARCSTGPSRRSATRGFWTPFPEVPSGKIYGENAREDGLAAYNARLGEPFALEGHPESDRVGAEVSPWGPALGITYPAADAETLVAASESAGAAWAAVDSRGSRRAV